MNSGCYIYTGVVWLTFAIEYTISIALKDSRLVLSLFMPSCTSPTASNPWDPYGVTGLFLWNVIAVRYDAGYGVAGFRMRHWIALLLKRPNSVKLQTGTISQMFLCYVHLWEILERFLFLNVCLIIPSQVRDTDF